MTLTLGTTYILTVFDKDTRIIKLVRVPFKLFKGYEWEHQDGRKFVNNESDVKRWISKNCIKELAD